MKLEDRVYALIKALKLFDYKIACTDHLWEIIFPDKKNKWHYMHVVKYHDIYYLSLIDKDVCSIESMLNQYAKYTASTFPYNMDPDILWNHLLPAALRWLNIVSKNWIKANKQVQENYPLNYRYGFVPSIFVSASLTDMYSINTALGKSKTKKFIQIVESDYFHNEQNITRKSMTANDFFDYCKIAYIAGQRRDDHVDKPLSGREMYQHYADGRDEGLLQIDPNSPQEFSDWLDSKHPKRTMGGHPWEIKRGGNTTHISLYVSRPTYGGGFKITLAGTALGRLKETICMFLALYEAKIPIAIADPDNIRKRLLGQDNIGLIPCYESLHRGNQLFHEEYAVFDVLYFDDLGRYKTRINPFITWLPLPILKPKPS